MGTHVRKQRIRRSIFGKQLSLRDKIIRGLILGFLIFFAFRNFVLMVSTMPSDVMTPALRRGERILISRSHYVIRLPVIHSRQTGRTIAFRTPQRGDIVLMKDPTKPAGNVFTRLFAFPIFFVTLGQVNLSPEHYVVRRIIALPNEKIEIRDKAVFVNDEPIDAQWEVVFSDERILPDAVANRDNLPATIVPFNSYFVLGDNRDYSYDSRNFGVVPRARIFGKVLAD